MVEFNCLVMTTPWRSSLRVPMPLKRGIIAPREQAAEIFRESLVKKQANERVNTAVDGGNELCDLNACFQVVAVLILQERVFLELEQEKHNTVRCPHPKEHTRYDGRKLSKIVLPLPGGLCFPHLPAAEYKHQQRKTKNQNVHL